MLEPYLQLEEEFGKWAGRPTCNMVACSSGTAALHLALEALSLPEGSSVIVPEFTMIACARAVTLAGLDPIFVDCDDELLINTELLPTYSNHVTKRTNAIMPVHVYGRRCNMADVSTLARRHKWAVVEDLAEAHGIYPHDDTDAACWSFYKNKIVAGEEGGIIAFKDPDVAMKARRLRSLGFTETHDFMHIPRGVNARMSNVHASLILESLSHFKENLYKRAQIEEWYDIRLPDEWRMTDREVCWVYDLRLPNTNTPLMVEALNQRSIPARLGFRPMSEQSEYIGLYQDLKAFKMSKEIIYLPANPSLREKDVSRTVEILKELMPLCATSPVS